MWVIWQWAVFPHKISMIAKLWRLRHQNSNSALAAPSRPVDPSSRVTRLGNLWRMWSSSDRSPIRTIYDFLNKALIYVYVHCASESQLLRRVVRFKKFNGKMHSTLQDRKHWCSCVMIRWSNHYHAVVVKDTIGPWTRTVWVRQKLIQLFSWCRSALCQWPHS